MATIYDVAKRAGVGKSAASAVLSGSVSTARFSEDTRQRVQQAALDLGYRPNAVARGLARGRMYAIGVLFSDVEPQIVTNPYATGVLQGIMGAAARAGYNVLLFTRTSKDIHQSASFIGDRSTDGILVIAPYVDSPVIATLAALDIPIVAVSSRFEDHGVPSVDLDNALGARLAVDHLLKLGHTRIAHIMGDFDHADSITRRSAFEAALHDAGIAVEPAYIQVGHYKTTDAYDCTRALLTLPNPPTAIFCGNDEMAQGALDAARDMGISVPAQLSVVGFDDVPLASLLTPPLTTVHQPLEQIGELATRLLIARMAGVAGAPQTHCLQPELVVRGSTGPVPPPK